MRIQYLLAPFLVSLLLPSVSLAKARFMPKEEMIESSNAIVIGSIQKVETLSPWVQGKRWQYRQKATVTVQQVLKGTPVKSLVLFGAEMFKCAQCELKEGTYLMFLKKSGNLWTGTNWSISLQPIRDGKIQWYGKADKHPISPETFMLKKDVLADISAVVSEQKIKKAQALSAMIDAVVTRPVKGRNHPELPALPTPIRQKIYQKLWGDSYRKSYAKLDAKKRNTEWSEAIKELEKQKAIWALLSGLCHYSDDVQIQTLRALRRLEDKRAVPFLLIYAEYMAVFERGSENATIHGIIHEEIAKTLSTLTGIEVTIDGQDPKKLKQGIARWRKWQLQQARYKLIRVANVSFWGESVKHPKTIAWGEKAENGLQMGGWFDAQRNVVFVLIRNEGKKPVKYSDYLLGYVERGDWGVTVSARANEKGKWQRLELKTEFTFVVKSAGATAMNIMTVHPGQFMQNPNLKFQSIGLSAITKTPGYTFGLSLTGFDFPESLGDNSTLRIQQSLGKDGSKGTWTGTLICDVAIKRPTPRSQRPAKPGK